MVRFDSEAALEANDLGRSMLQMLHDDDSGFNILPIPTHFSTHVNPFDEFRCSLASVDTAIQALQPQGAYSFILSLFMFNPDNASVAIVQRILLVLALDSAQPQ